MTVAFLSLAHAAASTMLKEAAARAPQCSGSLFVLAACAAAAGGLVFTVDPLTTLTSSLVHHVEHQTAATSQPNRPSIFGNIFVAAREAAGEVELQVLLDTLKHM
jgi:hypothetical protein